MEALQNSFAIVSRRMKQQRLEFYSMALLARWRITRMMFALALLFEDSMRFVQRINFKNRDDYNITFQIREPLFPIVCSTAAKTEMVLCNTKRDFANLQDRCRAAIMKLVRTRDRLETLKLPFRITNYLAESLCETPDAILNNYPNYYDFMVWDRR